MSKSSVVTSSSVLSSVFLGKGVFLRSPCSPVGPNPPANQQNQANMYCEKVALHKVGPSLVGTSESAHPFLCPCPSKVEGGWRILGRHLRGRCLISFFTPCSVFDILLIFLFLSFNCTENIFRAKYEIPTCFHLSGLSLLSFSPFHRGVRVFADMDALGWGLRGGGWIWRKRR